jgi:small subunit ribosomal protein S15
MALKRALKKKLIGKFRTHEKDTGSPQVQIGILTTEVTEITGHLKEHKKDNSARRGLLAKVARRRKLLSYLKMNDEKGYEDIVGKLNIGK